MPDGRASNGGARAGAGRKPRRDEEELRRLLKKCIPKAKWEAIMKKLGDDAESQSHKVRAEARKLLMAYQFGTPVPIKIEDGDKGNELPPDIAATIEKVYGKKDDDGATGGSGADAGAGG